MENSVDNYTTLAEILQDDAVGTAEPQVEETPVTEPEEMVETSRDDDAPQEQGTAKDFSVALNKRLAKERLKIEAELAAKHEADLQFAAEMRKLRGGKDYADILKDEFEARVKAFSAENSVPEGIARDYLSLKMGNRPAPQAPDAAPDPKQARFAALAAQVEEIKGTDGVDMMEVLQADEAIRAKVGRGEWDINRAYAHYLSSAQNANPPVSRATPVAAANFNLANMTKAQFDAIDARLSRGETIKFV